jgi:hypothetical protein
MCIILALAACADHGAAAEPDAAASLSPALADRARAAIAALDRRDNYRSADSSTLAWGESSILTSYYWMYEATRDPAWLDRIVRRVDVILSNLSPGEEIGPGWRTTRYSVALVEASAAQGNTSHAAIRPDPARIYGIATAHQVTGHAYEIEISPQNTMEIRDSTSGERIAAMALPADGRITQIAAIVLVIEGKPQPGDRFIVRTQAPKLMEYVVHDGMILTPIALFCAAVHNDGSLAPAYGEAARRYLEIMETQLFPKWEPYWRDLPDGGGAYTAQNDPAQRFPGATLPHNQYLALGRTCVALYRITGKALYRERAEKMARFFKRNLRLVGQHYEWNYWDYAGPWDEEARRMAHVEDTSHGHIDIGFVVDAYDAGMVFDREDMERFARTVAEVMWNGSEESPRVGSCVNSSKGDKVSALDWVRLGRFSLKTRQIMVRMLESVNTSGGSQAAAAAQALALERTGWSAQPLHSTARTRAAQQ